MSDYSPKAKAGMIFSMLQGTKYLSEILASLQKEHHDLRIRLMEKVSEAISESNRQEIGKRIIGVYIDQLPGFADAWASLESDGGSSMRIMLIERLAKGEYGNRTNDAR